MEINDHLNDKTDEADRKYEKRTKLLLDHKMQVSLIVFPLREVTRPRVVTRVNTQSKWLASTFYSTVCQVFE